MAYPVTLNGRTYTLADFEGTNYVDGLPDAFEDFVTHAGDIYNSTSTSSVAIGTGSKTFTTADSGKPYQAGTPLRIADAAAPSTNFMDCIVTSYSGTTLVVNVFGFAGSGTKSDWTINIGGAKTVDGTLPVSQGGTGATTAADAADNLGLGATDNVTFGTVTADGLTVDGNVGIGTSSPATILHLAEDNPLMRFEDTAGGAPYTFDVGSDGGLFKVINTTSATTPFVIEGATGDVGIGIVNPSAQLHLVKSGGALIKLGTSKNTSEIKAREVGAGNSLVFSSNNSTDHMTIDIGGNVGIGTSTPNRLLEISSAGATFTRISSTASGGSYSEVAHGSAQGNLLLSADAGNDLSGSYIQMSVDGSEAMRIDSSGNVGIGETNPAGKLHITSTGSASAITPSTLADELVIEHTLACGMSFLSPNFSTQSIFFGDSDDVDAGGIQYDHNVPAMYFREEGSTAMTIKNGNVGIGTTSPAAKLDVNGDMIADHFIYGNVTTTATSKTLAAGEVCFVTAATQTITLPASPSAGHTVKIGVGDFTDTVVGRNGNPIMGVAEDLTIDSANVTLTFLYVDASIGWRII